MPDLSRRGQVPHAQDIHSVFVLEDGGALEDGWEEPTEEGQKKRLEAARWTAAACELEAYYFRGDMKPLLLSETIQGTKLLRYVETREPGEFRSDLATHFEFHAFAALSQVILKLSRGRKVSILMAGDGESVGGNFTKGGPVALEEALCLQSTLHASLRRAAKLAELQGIDPYIPEHGAILSPNVQIFREGPEAGFRFLPEPLAIAAVVTILMPDPANSNYQTLLAEKVAAALEVASAGNALIVPELTLGQAVDPRKFGDTMSSVLLTLYPQAFQEVHYVGSDGFLSACRLTHSDVGHSEVPLEPTMPQMMAAGCREIATPLRGAAGQRWSLPPVLDSLLQEEARVEDEPRRSRRPSLLSAPGLLTSAEGAQLEPRSASEAASPERPRRSSMRQPSLLSAPGALGSSLRDEVLHRYQGDHGGDSQPRDVSSSVHAEHEHGGSPGQRSSGQRRASLPQMGTVSPEHAQTSGNLSSRRRSWSPSAAEHGHAPHASNASHAAVGEGSTLSSCTSDEEEPLHDVTGRPRAATDAAVSAAASGERRGESCEEEAVWHVGHVGLSPHSAPELQDTQGRRGSSMRQPSLLSAPGALGSSLPDEVLHRYQGDHMSRQVSQATDVAGVSSGEFLEQQAAWHGSLAPHSAPELHAGNPAAGALSHTSLLSAPGALCPASPHRTHRPHEIQEVCPMHPELEGAGDSASGTIIMDSGSFGIGDVTAALARQDELELALMASQLGHDEAMSRPESPMASLPGTFDAPICAFFEELETWQRQAAEMLDPAKVQQELRVTREKLEELQSLRASVAQQRRHLAERQAGVARAKDRLREELKHNSSKGGCCIS